MSVSVTCKYINWMYINLQSLYKTVRISFSHAMESIRWVEWVTRHRGIVNKQSNVSSVLNVGTICYKLWGVIHTLVLRGRGVMKGLLMWIVGPQSTISVNRSKLGTVIKITKVYILRNKCRPHILPLKTFTKSHLLYTVIIV